MKTHWKKTIDKDWIGTYVLPDGKPIDVRLISIKYQEVSVKGVKGMYKVAYFAKNEYFDKPMLLSSTKNLQRIATHTGTPYIEDWTELDLMVTLQQEMDKSFGGGKDWALRISPTLPKTETMADYPKEKELLINCKSLEELKNVFAPFPKNLKIIFNDLKNELKTKLS